MKNPIRLPAASFVIFVLLLGSMTFGGKVHAQVHGVTLQNCRVMLQASGKVMGEFWPGLTYNPCTAVAQQWLNEIYLLRIAHGQGVSGWPYLAVDGLFGNQTTYAVFEYRKRYGMVPAGSIDYNIMGYMVLQCVSKPWGHRSQACF